MSELLEVLSSHLHRNGIGNVISKNPDDVVITYAKRTAFCRALKGEFREMYAMDILYPLLKDLIQSSGIEPSLVNEVTIGNCLSKGSGALQARAAVLSAGFPVTTTVHTLNRQCGSGLTAINNVANAIRSGDILIGIGGGVESMSMSSMDTKIHLNEGTLTNQPAYDCFIPMGITAENVVEDFDISREDQDKFAVNSFHKAARATDNGYFKNEIVPVKVRLDGKDFVVSKDSGIRPGTTVEGLSKLKASFKEGGSVHPGNSSQMTDGAAIVLMMKRSMAARLGLKPLGKYLGANVAGVPPRIMGIGPRHAIPTVLERYGLNIDDVDIFELNEAFASQVLYCARELGIPDQKLNPNGGAIALGHPLGATGARQVATILNELRRTSKKIGCVSMCIGTGMGMAAVVVAE